MADIEARNLFRLECLEVLNWPPCSTLPEFVSRQNPSNGSHDFSANLDSFLQPIDGSASIVTTVDSVGTITGFFESDRVIAESSNISMSINRAPFKNLNSIATCIKGSPCNVPFLPGFLEELDQLLGEEMKEENTEQESKFLNFERSEELMNEIPTIGKIVLSETPREEPLPVVESNNEGFDMFKLLDMVAAPFPSSHKFHPESRSEETEDLPKTDPEESTEEVPVNPVDPVEPVSKLIDIEPKIETVTNDKAKLKNEKFEHAKKLELSNEEESEYRQLLPTMARKYPFSLDPFQKASVLCMERGESLFVAAHTSAGKTVVAEYAIALCQSHRTRAVYTSPIKALSNQKFRDFKQIFGDVGLVTGDIQLHPEASCLIMTTEILRSMLYNGSEVIRDLEWVVFDEVHYINNEERGHVWEEVLIMLPAHVKIVMLSATVPNCVEFADWVGRIKNRRINVISTEKRPVPLEHFLYTGQDGKTQKDLFKIFDRHGQFNIKGYNDAKDAKARIHNKEIAEVGTGGGRGNQRGGGNRSKRRNWHGKNDKNIYLNLINFMKNSDQLPMVVFVFSRKRCDENARILSSMDLTTEVEKQHVRTFFSQCIQRLKGSDKELPQVVNMRELCLRGFAVHHSGILPILKEVVELLFQKGYVKILFATETFAMGVNMPARCVVFDSLEKHDGSEKRILNPGEYTQMAGRAGRRGLDSTGTVVVICKDNSIPPSEVLKNVMSGSALRLESKFRVTYSMILNLLRVEQLKIEDMLKRSYVESDSLRESKEKTKSLIETKEKLEAIVDIDCVVCSPSEESSDTGLRAYHDALSEYVLCRQRLWPRLIEETGINRLLSPGRFLIVTSDANQLCHEIVVLVKELSNKHLQVLVASENIEETYEKKSKLTEYLHISQNEAQWLSEENAICSLTKFGLYGASPCSTTFSSFRLCELPVSGVVAILKKCVKGLQSAEVLQEHSIMMIPRFKGREISENILKILQQLRSLLEFSGQLEMYSMDDLCRLCQGFELTLELSNFASLEQKLQEANTFPARHCTRFDEHFKLLRDRLKVERRVAMLEYELSSDALLLSEEYRNRVKVLETLGFVEQKMVSLKGRIGCEIHHQELLITELILDYKFHQRSPAELAALLSTLTCQYNGTTELNFPSDSVFGEISRTIKAVLKRLESVASCYQSQISDLGCEIRFDLMEVVYQWANGMPFAEIMIMTDCQEGLIVKCIQRLDEVCKDIRNAGRIVGDPALVEKMEEVSASIRRDIVFTASLYTV